ncbi:MAG: class I SAM-dependent DNA methyltransferase, partial [Anaerolineales bacterium]|nr:class I SAM-dependent DNA methyltransferase [Anaerolineales bacterium]
MTPAEFVAKWAKIQQKETAVSQSHFNDVCRLVGHQTPLEHDPDGKLFTFETQAVKPDGSKGFADVAFRGHFIWEYKGPHKDLDKAYQQLQLYREHLHNPPLLITSDIHTIIIHTNFNNYPRHVHKITLTDIASGDGVEKLRWAFFDPDQFKPAQTQEQITKASADTFLAVADAMKEHQRRTGEHYGAEQLAHFLVRLLFCLFAEDMKLLPPGLFTQILHSQDHPYGDLQLALGNLFREMRRGGSLIYRIRHFNGTLFDDEFVPTIPHDLARALLQAAEQDWSAVDPSIFGTLFERVIDADKRAQLGAHYTSEDDIMLIVEPVLLAPLKAKWDSTRRQADRLLRQSPIANPQSPDSQTAHQLLTAFAVEIAATRVLDPACGSGNFLYVALRELLTLQKEVIAFAARRDLPEIPLTVSPQQLFGIEVNPYAHELAQITAWIGYLQWRQENGFSDIPDPVLQPLHNIQRMDAILAYDANGNPTEPEWPEADIIIGNPPFIGGNKIRQELGDRTVDSLFKLYDGRIPAFADLVCYWFEKARAQIERGVTQRAGLIATNSIRGGANREVLKRIKETGDIFMAWSDNPWMLNGAAVRVSIVGFDDGAEQVRILDGSETAVINPDLTCAADITQATSLHENQNICLRTDEKGGPFDISDDFARELLVAPLNPNNRPNSDVVFPWVNGLDIVRRNRNMWIIDFGANASEEEARQYLLPFKYVEQYVRPMRETNRVDRLREQWWLHRIPGAEMRDALSKLSRFIVTPSVAKHRLFVWLNHPTMPDHQLYAFAREDDYFFGVLHSRLHELWALRMGTWLGKGNDPRYTPTTTFETFPFPWPPGQEPSEAEDERVAEIGHWARTLHQWREAWLNPPPPASNVIDVAYEKMVKSRTLTNLYNGLVYYRETVQAGKPFDRTLFDKETR